MRSDAEKLMDSFMDIDDDPRNVFLINPEKVPEPPRSKVRQIIDRLKQKVLGDTDE